MKPKSQQRNRCIAHLVVLGEDGRDVLDGARARRHRALHGVGRAVGGDVRVAADPVGSLRKKGRLLHKQSKLFYEVGLKPKEKRSCFKLS
jgi:hypothetical protein